MNKKAGLRIVHFTSGHPPSDVRIFGREVRSLLGAGYDVTIIAPEPSDRIYPQGVTLRLVKRERTRPRAVTLGVWRVFREINRTEADLYHFHDPELIVVGLYLSFTGHRVIYDSHEDSSEIINTASWIPGFMRRFVRSCFRRFESLVATRMDAVVTANAAISKRFEKLNKRVIQVGNYPSLADFNIKSTRGVRTPGKIVDFGGISPRTCIDNVVTALTYIAPSQDFELVLAGETFSPALLEQMQASPAWARVRFVKRIPRNVMMTELLTAGVALVLYSPDPNHYGVGSNRFFEAMAAGVPVITSDFPAWRDVVESIGCGLTVNPTDPRAIAIAIEYMLTNPEAASEMGRRGRAAFEKDFNWEQEQDSLLRLYSEILSGSVSSNTLSIAPAQLTHSITRSRSE